MPQISGDLGTPRLDLGEALIEYPLTQLGFIGTQVLPPVEQDRDTGQFSTVTRESILRDRNVKWAPKTAASRDDHTLSPVTYRCERYAHEQAVDSLERSIYGREYQAEVTAALLCRDILLRAQEIRVATEIFNTTTFTGSALYTDLGTDWDNAAATIVADVDAAKEQIRKNCGMLPNTIIIPVGALPWIKANTDMKARLQYSMALTESAILGNLAQVFGIPRVLVGGAISNSADEGATINLTDVWNDNYCWLGVCATTGAITEACVGRTVAYNPGGGLLQVDQYDEPQTGCTLFRVRQHVDELIIDPYFGHLLKIDT